MVTGCPSRNTLGGGNARQRSIERRIHHLPLARAVRIAATAFFRFRYRSVSSPALWSEVERVWLGRETFLYWALCDTGIDIPRIVAGASGAPLDPDALRLAVRTHLMAYWKAAIRSTSRTMQPRWIPLP